MKQIHVKCSKANMAHLKQIIKNSWFECCINLVHVLYVKISKF